MASVAKPGMRSASAMDPPIVFMDGTVPAWNTAAISEAGQPLRQGDIGSNGHQVSRRCLFQVLDRAACAARPTPRFAGVWRKAFVSSHPSTKSRKRDAHIRSSDSG